MKQTLYVHRPLLNADEVIAWAKQQGFASTLDPDDMHVTVSFSKIPFDWSGLKEHKNKIHVKGGHRDVDHLGEKGAIVLHFDSPELHRRWQAIIDTGASWDYEGYHPHISITYDGGDLDPADMEPYVGDLIFGPEIFAPLQEDWDEKITEIPLNGKKNGVLENKSFEVFKYSESIYGEQTMNNSLASLLMKNIDLILEAYNIDEQGKLIEVNKKKVVESDDIFHRYFVQRMNETFRQINEADPIMDPGMNMHPQHSMNGMHPMGMGMGAEGEQEDGLGGDEMMGHMAMNDMHGGHGMHGMDGADGMDGGMEMGGGMGGHGMGGGMAAGAPRGNMPMESAGDDFDWVFNEETDLDVNSLFDLNEWEDDEEEAEHKDGDHKKLDEFMGGGDFLPDGDMDQEGGHNDFGGDMGGMSSGGQDMDMPSGMDMMGGGDEMGGDEDMVTVHGTTDQGGEFEFSFDPETLGFEGGGMGGHEDFLPGGGEGEEHHHHEEHEPHHSEHGEHEEPGMGEEEMGEAAQHWHNGKPGKGSRGKKSSRMAVVPANPATKHTAPFPSPMGNRQKK